MPRRLARAIASTFFFALLSAALLVRADGEGQGIGVDAQLTGGGGFAFGASLENYFLGRVRLGALYASQPWVVNLGLTAEIGALARVGVGGELELNHSSGPYASLGLARVTGDEWMTHASAGFMILGLEWQHRVTSQRPSDALVFHVRLPLGLWWQQKRQQSEAKKTADAQRLTQVKPFLPDVRRPLAPPTAAGAMPAGAASAQAPLSAQPSAAAGQGAASAAASAQSASPPRAAGDAAGPRAASPSAAGPTSLPLFSPEAEAERVQQLEAARTAHAAGDHAAEERALARVEALRPEGESALALAATQIEQGKLLAARSTLQRILATYELSDPERTRAEADHKAVAARLAHLRVVASGVQGNERVLLDDAPEPSALAGYDVPLNPGTHTVRIERDQRVLAERSFEASEGQLVRLTLELAP